MSTTTFGSQPVEGNVNGNESKKCRSKSKKGLTMLVEVGKDTRYGACTRGVQGILEIKFK